MPDLSKIDIDFEIYKVIETERRSFDEPPYLALRRLLKLGTHLPSVEKTQPISSGRPFVEDGISVPHGSLARMKYLHGSQVYEGHFLNGLLVINNEAFPSLSAAAKALAVTRKGGKTSLNGWNYWEAKFPGETKWRSLFKLREQTQKTSAT